MADVPFQYKVKGGVATLHVDSKLVDGKNEADTKAIIRQILAENPDFRNKPAGSFTVVVPPQPQTSGLLPGPGQPSLQPKQITQPKPPPPGMSHPVDVMQSPDGTSHLFGGGYGIPREEYITDYGLTGEGVSWLANNGLPVGYQIGIPATTGALGGLYASQGKTMPELKLDAEGNPIKKEGTFSRGNQLVPDGAKINYGNVLKNFDEHVWEGNNLNGKSPTEAWKNMTDAEKADPKIQQYFKNKVEGYYKKFGLHPKGLDGIDYTKMDEALNKVHADLRTQVKKGIFKRVTQPFAERFSEGHSNALVQTPDWARKASRPISGATEVAKGIGKRIFNPMVNPFTGNRLGWKGATAKTGLLTGLALDTAGSLMNMGKEDEFNALEAQLASARETAKANAGWLDEGNATQAQYLNILRDMAADPEKAQHLEAIYNNAP